MTSWQNCAIRDLGRVVTGKTPPAARPEAFGEDFQFVTPTDMVGQRFMGNTDRYLSVAGAELQRRLKIPEGSLMVSCIGWQLGKVAISTSDSFTNQQINTIIPDMAKVDPLFLYYHLGTRREELKRLASGGTRTPILNKSRFEALRVLVPPRHHQESIAQVLGAIDDLIENNRRRAEVLEEMARAIYREWFVKFHYPGHGDVPLVDSLLGPIPEGWVVRPLATIARVNGSSRKPRADEMIKYLDITALSERHIDELATIAGSDAPGRARRVVGPGDTVWATVRPNRRAHALLIAPGDDWIASTGLAVLTPSGVSPAFLFETTSTTAFSDWLVGRATGATYPAVRANDFEEALVIVPEVAVDAAFAEKVSPMHELCWKLRVENTALASLRDLLLPKLVTGQIDVSTLDLDALPELVA